MTMMTKHFERAKKIAFVVMLATALGASAVQQVDATGQCYSISPDYYQLSVSYWACGWFDSDACADGTMQAWCDYDCYRFFNLYYGGSLYSCVSTGGDGQWWVSSADCVCNQ